MAVISGLISEPPVEVTIVEEQLTLRILSSSLVHLGFGT